MMGLWSSARPVFKYKKPSMFNMGKGNEKKLWFNLNKLLFSYSDAKDQSDPPKASKVFSLDVISKVTIDLSKEAQSKYIIEIMTDKRNFRFKIKNLRGFFMIMEAFRHTKPKGRFDHLFNANLGYLERLHKFILEKGDQAQVPSKQTEAEYKDRGCAGQNSGKGED
jgi:hypothetical protein